MNKAVLQRKILFWIAATILFILLLSFIFIVTLPGITRVMLNDWFEDQGIASQIDNIDINLFTGEIRLVSIEPKTPQQQNLDLGSLHAKINFRDLWQKKITIENVSISDFHIDIKQDPTGTLRVGGIKTGINNRGPDRKPGDSAARTPWMFSIRKAVLKNIETCYSATADETQNTNNVCLMLKELKLNKTSGYLADLVKQKNNRLSTATLIITGTKLVDKKHNTELANLDEFKAEKITIDKHNKITIPKLEVSGATLFKRDSSKQEKEKDTSASKVNLVTLSNINISNLDDYAIESVNIDGVQANLVREKDGQLSLFKKVRIIIPSTKKTAKPAAKKAGKSPRLRIDNISVNDNAQISIVDHSVSPVFREQISNFSLALGDIDTHEPSKNSPVKTAFTVGKHGNVRLAGNVALFSERASAQLKGTIHRLNTANYTGYAFEFIKHHIKRGILDADLTINMLEGKHDSEAKLKLHKFYIEEGSESANAYYTKEFGVSLPRALSMLREKDESIKLNMVVKGDVKDPQFSWSYTINHVIADAIKNSIVNYYTNLSIEITILKALFKTVKSLHFEPVIYLPLEAKLDDSKRGVLNNLVTLLTDRPHIELSICGYATKKDRLKLYPETQDQDASALSPEEITKLDEFALQRQTMVQDYLVKEKGIASKRLIPCNPRYADTDEEPRVEFSF